MTAATSSHLLSPREIAAWQIPGACRAPATVRAELPALQRGAVWRAPQVEALWDSVLRGFPIGAFLLAPFQRDRGHKDFPYQSEDVSPPVATHHLLDGQQRSNALALGFLNPWQWTPDDPASAALWVDLEAPSANDERDFVFRLLTRSHPWGYRRSSAATEGPRLAAHTIREAVAAYACATPEILRGAGGRVPLTRAWPWDAGAPVPFCLLLDAIDAGGEDDTVDDIGPRLLARLADLPFWAHPIRTLHDSDARQRVTTLLRNRISRGRDHIERVIDGAQRVLGKSASTSYRVAALVVPDLGSALSGPARHTVDAAAGADPQDPMETLFIRINAGGTALGGEELVYSILKSIWPDAERCIQAVGVRLAAPSRIVALAARLVLADAAASERKPPATPDVARFRRLVHGSDRDCPKFRSKILAFFDGTGGKAGAAEVFGATHALLTSNGKCELPTVVVAAIARHNPDVMFLLLRWVQRMLRAGNDLRTMTRRTTCRVIGAITALSWFAEDDGRCLSALWPGLQTAEGNGLRSFFSAQRFVRAYRLTRGKFGLLPLVPPAVLEDAVDSCIFGYGFNTPAGGCWQNWTWDKLVDRPVGRLGTKLEPWFARSFDSIWARVNPDDATALGAEELDLGGLHQQAWRSFVEKLWGEKGLLLFAQRDWLTRWLSSQDYDPTSADQLDEADRPWDFDHIHPASYIRDKRNVPQLVRAWHGSIGNLRAWPLQANRSDGDGCPRDKLAEERARDGLAAFGISCRDELLAASFVDPNSLCHWGGSTPQETSFPAGYLGKPAQFGEQRKNLVRAVVSRWLRLYRHWHETLRIADLGP